MVQVYDFWFRIGRPSQVRFDTQFVEGLDKDADIMAKHLAQDRYEEKPMPNLDMLNYVFKVLPAEEKRFAVRLEVDAPSSS